LKGGRAILRKFKGEGRYFNMLQTLFPDVGLRKSDFYKRSFLLLSPLSTLSPLSSLSSLLSLLSSSLSPLLSCPPSPSHSLPLVPKFIFYCVGYSHDINHRREYFESYAKKMGFDPKKAENWSAHTKKNMVAEQVREFL
jgi:hypothetical protein